MFRVHDGILPTGQLSADDEDQISNTSCHRQDRERVFRDAGAAAGWSLLQAPVRAGPP